MISGERIPENRHRLILFLIEIRFRDVKLRRIGRLRRCRCSWTVGTVPTCRSTAGPYLLSSSKHDVGDPLRLPPSHHDGCLENADATVLSLE